jgi:hypothetical protein
MIAAIHQPNFLPWVGFFYKFYLADYFVFLDDAQYSKNSFINRNRIKTPQGTSWLTLPIQSAGKFGQSINEVKIFDYQNSTKKVLSTIKMNYAKTKYFKEYYPQLEEIVNESRENLISLNINLISWINNILNIKKKYFLSSNLTGIQGDATERLIQICKKLDCSIYLSGYGGSKYQDETLFANSGIELMLYNFIHPSYSQLWGDFIPNLSVIDLIFNCGSESKSILSNT